MRELHKTAPVLNKIVTEQKLNNSKTYIRSQFAYTLREGESYYIFNTLTKQCFESDKDIPDNIITPVEISESGFLTELLKGRFIVPSDLDECAYYEGVTNILRLMSRGKGYQKYVILPTTACNARCVYCFEEGMKQVSMTDETADSVAEYIAKTRLPDKEIILEWFGGEPLLGIRRIDRITKKLRDMRIPFKSGMITNASLITDEVVDKMINKWNMYFIQISMDGGEEEYIRRKCYPSYKNYYQAVIKYIKKLAGNKIYVSIRCNIDENNLYSVPEFINDLDRFIPDKNNVGVIFHPLDQVRRSDKCASIWNEGLKLGDRAEALGFQPSGYSEVLDFKINYCIADAASSNVVIAPDGKLYNCEVCEDGTSFGDIKNGITNQEIINSYQNYGKTRERCQTCVFLPECTSFSKCPNRDSDCKKVRELLQKRTMKKLIEQTEIDTSYKTRNC